MPQLPVFTAQIGAAPTVGGRRAGAEDFATGGVAAGRAIQRVAESIISDKEEQESRTALISSSEIRAKYARALDEAALSDTDTEKLKEQMQDELSRVGDGFETVRGSQSLQLYASNTEIGFDEQANRIKITRAAATARLEGSKFLNSESELLRSNPGYLASAEKNADAFAATLKHISPEQRAEIQQGLKKELNMAAAVSAARMDPERTKTRLEAGEWDLTPQQREQAVGKADMEIRAKRADEAYQRSVKEYEERERDDEARDTHFAAIIGGTATRRSIMDDPKLRPATREHLVTFMEARAKERLTTEKQSDPGTKNDLWMRIHAPDTDARKIFNGDAIFEAVKAGKLNTTDANQLNVLVANQRDDNNRTFGTRAQGFMATIGRAMMGSAEYSNRPELAAAIQMELVSQLEQRSAALRAENKSPDTLLDPESKDFFFKPGTLKATAEIVKQRERDAAPKLPDLRTTPDAWRGLQDGDPFVDPHGRQNTMTPALRAALTKQAPAALDDFAAWMSATGGVLQPGETQDQAIARWKAGK